MGCVADSRWLRGAGTALLSLWWSTCGGDFAGIAVTIHQLPVGTTSVVVTPSVNGRNLVPEVFSTDIAGLQDVTVGFHLHRSNLGSPVEFKIDARNDKSCVIATGDAKLTTDAVRRYDIQTSLNVVAATSAFSGNLFAVHGSQANDVWAVGGTGLAVHWDGCGWKQQQPSFTSATLLSVYVAPRATGQTTPSQAWALDDTNSIWRFDGASWAKEFQLPATPTGRLAAIHGSSGADVWAVGTGLIQMGTSMVPSGCIIYHSNGQEWQAGNYCAGPATNIKTYSLNYVYAIDGQSAVAAGGASATQKVGFYKVGAWAPAPPLTMDSGGDASAIWASSAGDVWVGGPASLLHHYAGTTGQWTPDNSLQAGMSTNEFVYRLWGTAATDVWAISFAPGLGKSRLFRYKGSWQQQTLTSPYAVVAGWSASSSDVWLVGYGAVRIHFDGQSFTEFR